MELFRNARKVCLQSSHGEYLVAKNDEETVFLGGGGFYSSAQWSVEFVLNSESVLRLKSCYGKYLAASDQLSPVGMTGCKVLQSLPPLPDSSLELEPVREDTHIKLRTHYGTFVRANRDHREWRNSVTHDLPHCATILWVVTVLEGEGGGSATNIDDKVSEEGSATKRHSGTGEGSSVTQSPPGDSCLIREGNEVRHRRHFWKLKILLSDDSRRKDVLVRGGSGTTALVREVCADVREHYGTIAWISIPQKKDSELIREEILPQLIFEGEAFPHSRLHFSDREFSLREKAGCLIVVDNLDDQRTWKKFEEILHIVKTCRVTFIARREMGSSYNQIHQNGRQFETYELEDLSYVPRAYHLKGFLEEGFPSPSKGVRQLIVSKCERLPTAIVFVLHSLEEWWPYRSSEIKDEWEARILSGPVNLCKELHRIQKVLASLYKDPRKAEGIELDHFQQVLEIIYEEDLLFCFLYLSIFPKNSLISCKKVSRLWAAEGLLPDLGTAEHFFDELLLRKCIRPVEKKIDGELSTFQVDQRVRKTIVSLSNLRHLVTKIRGPSTNWPGRIRYLSVQGAIQVLNEEKPFKLSSMFALNISSNKDETTTFEASPSNTSETPRLVNYRVLDLTGVPFQIDPVAIFMAIDLRYLCLRNTSIKVIPRFIENLTHLEFLDLKHTLVTELPQKAEGLKGIRHILIYHHEKDPLMESYNLIGFKASCSVRGFKCLEKLCFVEADERILKDLGNLTKLRRLGITKLRAEHNELLCSFLLKLISLKSLNVHAFDKDEIIDLNGLSSSPPKFLTHLYLHGRLEKLPDWTSSHDGLTRIILRWSQLKEDLLATLGKLKNLVELELREAYDGERLEFKEKQFPMLKILLLDKLGRLISMSLEINTMPCLETLTISRCPWLERIPTGIEHIHTIRKLTFFDMSHEFHDKVREDHKKNNSETFKHIPQVYFTRWKAGHWVPDKVESKH